jgi:hypothetical protein
MNDNRAWKKALAECLFEKALCSSRLESATIVESIAEERDDTRDPGIEIETTEIEYTEWNQALQDYLGISVEESQQILDQCRAAVSGSKEVGDQDDNTHVEPEEESSLEDTTTMGVDDDDDADDSDSEYLGPGECELCERYIQLTRHHLIPKSTWPRIEAKLQRGWQAWSQGSSDRAEALEVCSGLMQTLMMQEEESASPDSVSVRTSLSKSKLSKSEQQKQLHSRIRAILKWQTCQICRQCHSAIHRFHDNMSLAQLYNTTELLLQDKQVYTFCHWASKQRARTSKHAAK